MKHDAPNKTLDNETRISEECSRSLSPITWVRLWPMLIR
jgi:hypothetical protein